MTTARVASAGGAPCRPAARCKKCAATAAASPREWSAADRLWFTMGRPRPVRPTIMSDMEFSIDNAARRDLPEILAIYNEVIRNSTAIYTEEEFAPARGDAWYDGKMEQGFPMIVARDTSGIAGFGTFGEF